MSLIPLPVIVICGEAGSGKTTLSNALVEKFGFYLVDGDNIHQKPPWNDMTIMHELCVQFICDDAFMRSTIETIIADIKTSIEALSSAKTLPLGIVMPFVMYTQKSRRYLADRLNEMRGLVSHVRFVWLQVDSHIHKERNEDRVERWAAAGISMRPDDLVNLTKSLCAREQTDDCLVLDNSSKDFMEDNLAAIIELCELNCP